MSSTWWHRHRGFETVTYPRMTAGAGILHIEQPPEHLVKSGGVFWENRRVSICRSPSALT
ncbi:hypothetical protein ACQEV2_01855 [Streptomyces sp. CA-251387]|uniref:hypothetical protein n=1 Tax=Streptomyces sp. CA-251387 TaxID=3240064 RepID=UPI003D911BAD